MSEKRELHSLCAAVVNEQAPRVGTNLVTGTARRSSLFDLGYTRTNFSLTLINEEMYEGARPCKDLKTNKVV